MELSEVASALLVGEKNEMMIRIERKVSILPLISCLIDMITSSFVFGYIKL
jgi:hypothetical protein